MKASPPAPDRSRRLLHPHMITIVNYIEHRIIKVHRAPFKLFETARTPERQAFMTKSKNMPDPRSFPHSFDLDVDPPLLSTAVTFVFYNDSFSWDLRSRLVRTWYEWLGVMVTERCPDIEWGGDWRRGQDVTHFQLRRHKIQDYNLAQAAVTQR